MPRTIDATLEAALASGSYEAFFECILHVEQTPEETALRIRDVLLYKLHPSSMEVKIAFNTDAESGYYNEVLYVTLRRGIKQAGTEYYLDTSAFSITTLKINGHIMTINADLLPDIKISLAGDDTYWNTIQAFATACDMTATRKAPLQAYWDNIFLPAGKMLVLNKARQLEQMLKQKFFMNFADNGANSIIFYSAGKIGSLSLENTIYTEQLLEIEQVTGSHNVVGLMWRDETSSLYKPVAPYDTAPLYNIGFIKSGDEIPSDIPASKIVFRQIKIKPINLPINLTYQTGDNTYIASTNSTEPITSTGILEITEYFDNKVSPSWGITINLWDFIANSEGGTLPSTIERVAAYTPLVSTGFDGNLSPEVNNLQALAQAVDDMTVSGTVAWADVTGAVEGAQDAVGAMVADTATIDITYTDATPQLKADVKAASITEAMQVLADNTTQDVNTSKHGYVPKAPNDTAKFLRGDATWAAPAGGGAGLFGDGDDGDVTITGGTTTLTRDMYYNNLTITSTGILDCYGFKVYVKTKLSIEAGGIINNNGKPGVSAAAGGAGTTGGFGAGSAGGLIPVLNFAMGGDGGGGAASGGAGTANGAAGAAGVPFLDQSSSTARANIRLLAGGGGGGGGAHGSAAVAGTAGAGMFYFASPYCAGGAGGAGTGTASVRYAGGAGGGGAGMLEIWTNEIDNAGELQAKGGAGGNGLTNGTTTKSGNGGGGGGGVVLVFYRTTSGSGLGTLTAAGGAKGTTGNGGANGSTGITASYQI